MDERDKSQSTDAESSDRDITFGGSQKGSGVNIPGGLREAEHPAPQVPEGQYVDGYPSTDDQPTEDRSSENVGEDKNVSFGGSQKGSGVNIPGGLREPESSGSE